jgi:hypothetical protein
MSTKRTPKYDSVDKTSHVANARLPSQIIEVLQLLQQKVVSSPALNGGFDTLMAKVDSIHDAIYHPDEGLFARVKVIEQIKEKLMVTDRLEKEIFQLQQWRESQEKIGEKEEKLTDANEKLVKEHIDKIKDLVEFKTRVSSAIKWSLVTLGGGLITGIGKILYDLLSGHITVH